MLSIFLCSFSCLFTFLFSPIEKSHTRLLILKDSGTFTFYQDLPNTEIFYPVFGQNLNQKLIKTTTKIYVVGFFKFVFCLVVFLVWFFFFLVRGSIWIFFKEIISVPSFINLHLQGTYLFC